jgi:hypothetical protein
MATSEPLPKSITISGGMTTGKVSGNGWWFRNAGLASIVSENVQAPYVRDHGSDLKDIAGQVDRVFVMEEGTVELDIVSGPNRGKKKPWPYMTIGHESTLTSDHSAYDEVARHILATAKSGKVPQESISFQIGGISYDEETDQVIFEAPFRLVHHSSVSRGAFGPDVGVGVKTIKSSVDSNPTTHVAGTISNFSPNSVHIANIEEMTVAFAASHANNFAAISAAHRTGLAVVAPQFSVAHVSDIVASGAERLDSYTQGGMVAAETSPMADPQNPAGKTPAAPVTLSAEDHGNLLRQASEGAEAFMLVQKLQKKLEAAETAELAAEQDRIAADYGQPKDRVLAFKDRGALKAFEDTLRESKSSTTGASPAKRQLDDAAAKQSVSVNAWAEAFGDKVGA